jgi:hypothetical protein
MRNMFPPLMHDFFVVYRQHLDHRPNRTHLVEDTKQHPVPRQSKHYIMMMMNLKNDYHTTILFSLPRGLMTLNSPPEFSSVNTSSTKTSIISDTFLK